MLIYLVSCKLEEFKKYFKHRCEKLVFQSDYLEGDSLYLYMYVRDVWSKSRHGTQTHYCVFLYVLSPIYMSFDYGFISFVGFTLIFILIAPAYNYYSYVFWMVSFSRAQWKCHFCYYVWRKGFHFPFLFRDIFWSWAECEASLIFKGHAQCKKADWDACGKYDNESIFRMLEWEGSQAAWPPHSGDEKMKWVTLQGSGPALGKLRARSTKCKKRGKMCFHQKQTLPHEFESKQFIWEGNAGSQAELRLSRTLGHGQLVTDAVMVSAGGMQARHREPGHFTVLNIRGSWEPFHCRRRIPGRRWGNLKYFM